MEEWRPVPVAGFRRSYDVSNRGRVRNRSTGRILSQTTSRKGYRYATLWLKPHRRTFQVHRLVALAFVPRVRSKPIVHHKNRRRADNRAVNLAWVTKGENTRLSRAAGAWDRWERRLDLKAAGKMRRQGMSFAAIGQIYGVTKQAVYLRLKRHGL